MIMSVVIATAVPIRIDLDKAERARCLNGDSSLYIKVPKMHVLSIRAPSSVPSIMYSFQCAFAASLTDADGGGGVAWYWRVIGMSAADSQAIFCDAVSDEDSDENRRVKHSGNVG